MAASTTTTNPSYRYGEPNCVFLPFAPGVPVNGGDICFQSQPTRTVADGSTTSTSTTLGSASALFTPGDEGAAVSGSGIPASTTIVSVQSSTSATMSAAATATATGVSVTIAPSLPVSIYPAMSYPWTTNLATTQLNFAKQCAGVSAQTYDGVNGSAYGIQDGTLRCDTTGVFDFPCASQVWNVGDLVAPDQDGSNSNLFAQRVVSVNAAGAANAIGRVIKAPLTATTTVRVQLFAAADRLVNAGVL